MPGDSLELIESDENSSVDDFIRELEAKEKDLHITSDLKIEIENADFEISDVSEFVHHELAALPTVDNGNHAHHAHDDAPVPKGRDRDLEREIASLKIRVMELKDERRDIQEKSDRRLKDFENFKYRIDRERRGAFIDQIGNLAAQMLPVLDNLNRALDSADEISGERTPEFQQFFDGIVLVNQQLNEVFAGMGVTSIVTVGEAFDPNFHEAVATEERSDMPANTVSGELLRGYRIGNKVIRHSMVRVTIPSSKPPSVSTPVDYPSEPPSDSEV